LIQQPIDKLIKACIKGNEKAQIQLYEMYCQAMFTIACRYLKNEEDAKDAMQDGFIKAFTKIESYTSEYTFGAWLKRIIINQCLDVLKKKYLETTSINSESLQLIDDENWNVDISITKEMIESAVEQLPEKYMLVVKLYLMEGYDHEEISQILEIPVKTSRTHLRRGRLQLKELLKTKRYGTGY